MIPLYEHQKKAIEKMHNGCILCGGVGSGKSRTALAYFYTKVCGGRLSTKQGCDDSPMKRPRALYVITTARKRDSLDWQGEAIYFGISTDQEISPILFVVDSWNNLYKYTDVKDAFFIFDEQRVVGYGAWTKSFLQICKNNQWILLSATPGDTWMDYVPVFIANGFYKNKTQFVTQHVIFSRFAKYPKVERYINCDVLVKYKNRVLVNMPFVRNTISHPILVDCGYDKHAFMRIYRGRWNVFEDRPIIQAGEWCYAMRRVVNSDPERFGHLLDIIEEKKKVIVFYNFDYELEILRDGLNEYFLDRDVKIAEYNGHVHNEVPNGDMWVYLVQYNAGSEAWNCITTDTIVFYSLNYSYKMMEQASGRINRANTPFYDLYYYILKSDSTIDKSILTALRNKKDFNESRYFSRQWKKE